MRAPLATMLAVEGLAADRAIGVGPSAGTSRGAARTSAGIERLAVESLARRSDRFATIAETPYRSMRTGRSRAPHRWSLSGFFTLIQSRERPDR
jgi:hypothetical protein